MLIVHVTCASRVLLQHRELRKCRTFLPEALVDRSLEYLVGKLGEGVPPLPARKRRMGMGVGVESWPL